MPSADGRRLERWIPALLVAAACAAVYGPCRGLGFVNVDDPSFINPPHPGLGLDALRWMTTQPYFCNYVPAALFSYGVDRDVWGGSPAAYHLTSVLLHAANAALLYALCLSLFPRPRAPRRDEACAAAAALLYALHPLRVQSVAWVAERRDVLCGFFLLLTLHAWLRGLEPRPGARRWRAAAWAAHALALLSKPAAAPLPLVLLILDVWPLKRLTDARSLRERMIEKLPFFALSAAATAAAFAAQKDCGAVVSLARALPGQRLRAALIGLVFYTGKTLWPARLSFYEWHWAPVRGAVLLGAAATAAWLAAAARWPRARPALLAALAAQTVLLLPTLGWAPVGHELVADRYAYLSGLPLALLAAAGLRALPARRRAAAAALVVAALGLLAARTRAQIGVWSDTESLWRGVLRADPLAYGARPSLASALTQKGETDEARLLLEEQARLHPDDAETRADLERLRAERPWTPRDRAAAYERLGRAAAARGEAERAAWFLERARRESGVNDRAVD
jgi:hypothetical protein